MKNKETVPERTERLNASPEGRALLALLNRHPSHAQTARELGLVPGVIAQWLVRGRVSRTGARLAESRLGIRKEGLRPDISPDGWSLGTPGRMPGAEVVRDGVDQQVLAELVKHYGSVRKFCEAANIRVGQFHNWLSRDRIAAWAIPRLCSLDIPAPLRSRMLADDWPIDKPSTER